MHGPSLGRFAFAVVVRPKQKNCRDDDRREVGLPFLELLVVRVTCGLSALAHSSPETVIEPRTDHRRTATVISRSSDGSREAVTLREMLRNALTAGPEELFRRYFINTVFDSTFVAMGVLASTALVPEANPEIAIETLFAACLAIGISSGVSVYEAESIESDIHMQRLERAMLSRLTDTEIGRRMHASRLAIAAVNFTAPLVVAAITGTPILLHQAGIVGSLGVAALISGALGLGIILAAGYYLGSMTRRPWLRAVRMLVIALLTFTALIFIERLA